MRIFLLFFIAVPVLGLSQDLSQLRTEYPRASQDVGLVDSLLDGLSGISKNDENLVVAYKGALLTLRAKYASGIKTKKNTFKEGVTFLEHAITIAPKNIEIRCLRLGVQENAPKIVGYRAAIQEDKQFILNHFQAVTNPEIKKFIRGYVQLSSAFNDSEKELF